MNPYNYSLLPFRRFLARLCIIMGVILVLFGIVRADSERIQKEEGILALVDISRSMAVEDIIGSGTKSASRIESAKMILESIAQNTPHALMTFTDVSHLQIPFSSDPEFWKVLIGTLQVSSFGGVTDIGGALASVTLLYPDRPMMLLVFTDGEDTTDTSFPDIQLPKNISLIFIGIGSQEGGKIFDRYDGNGNTLYKTFQGKEVISRLDLQTLKKLQSDYYSELITVENFDQINTAKEKIQTLLKERLTPSSINFWMLFGVILILFGLIVPDYRKK